MQDKPYIVIMAGGVGSRFWPSSRNTKPKQFLDILGTGRTLLQMTFDRFSEVASPDQFLVVTHFSYTDLVKEQLPKLAEHQILAEPLRRNTAACIAYAAFRIQAIDPNAVMIVTPVDHLILQENKFLQAIHHAVASAAEDGKLITLGIKPNQPATGYGYIQYHENDQEIALKVKTFTEKPSLKLAKTFLDSGDFVWNSGMFVWKAKSFIDQLHIHLPDMADAFEGGQQIFGTSAEKEFINRAYSLVKNISIDYGLMEKSDQVYVILGDFGWSDLGSWHSLHDLRSKDEHNNVVEANAVLFETQNSYIKTDSDKLVVIQGLENYLVNESDNVLLICKLGAEEKFRDFVATAKKKGEDYI